MTMTCISTSAHAAGDENHTAKGTTCPVDEDGELCEKLRAYLDCRLRNVEIPAPLAEAWDQFYGDYAPRIRRFLLGTGLPADDLDDCLQTVWSEILTHLPKLSYDSGRGRLSTWLMTVARNRAVDAIRYRSRRTETPLDDPESLESRDVEPASACESLAAQHRMRQVLSKLSTRVSPLSFQVLYQRAIDGRSTTEVADALGLTPGQVRFRLHRMKRKVRELCELKSCSENPHASGSHIQKNTGNFQEPRNTPTVRANK